MILTITDFMLKDIGSPGYTEYEFGEEMIDLYEERPELITRKMGHLHTHHQMKAYFSGTDKQCLHDNAPNFDMFLSIIVNTEGMKIAKIAFISKIKHTVSFMNVKKWFSFSTEPEDYLAILDAKVEILQDDVVEEFNKVLKEKKEKQAKTKKAHKNYSTGINVNGRKTVVHQPQGKNEVLKLTANSKRDEQIEMFNEADSEEIFDDDYIENLLVRSFYRDDLASEELGTTITDVRDDLDDDNQRAVVNMMFDHFIQCINEEYFGDDFERVANKSIGLLLEYRNFRFINQFVYLIRQWIDRYNTPDDKSGGDDSYFGNPLNTVRRDGITKSKNKIENEF